MPTKIIYLPGLNGLRAIAAMSVVMAHTMIQLANLKLMPRLSFPIAQYSVTLFFVISGFLITYLLLHEKELSKIIIKNFYFRRILRIWPLYYLYILICLLFAPLDSTFNYMLSNRIYWYIFFAANFPFIFNQGIDGLGHYWSIGVEEQFYLFWPLIMKLRYKWIMPVIILLMTILLSAKFANYFFLGKQSIAYQISSVIRFPCMMIGAIGSLYYYKKQYLFLKIINNIITQILAWVALFCIGFETIHIPSVIVHEVFSALSLVVIIGQVTKNNRILNLDNKLLNFLGEISYGIYIIHPIVIIFSSYCINKLPINLSLKCFTIGFIVLFATVGAAHLSYTYFEKPFLRLKNKFTTIKSSNNELALAS